MGYPAGRSAAPVAVRRRVEADLPACEALARTAHRLDGYPVRLPADLRAFVAGSGALDAWVAEADGTVVGHVALHRSSSRPVMRVAEQSTGLEECRFAVVARLLVAASARRRGTGARLLSTAADRAARLGRHAILDVGTALRPAIALYEHCGWVRLGPATFQFTDGGTLDEFVYGAPTDRGGTAVAGRRPVDGP